MDELYIVTILDLLKKQYGSKQLTPHYNPLAELVQTILSQNTSDINSRPAFRALQQSLGSWQNIMDADTSQIAKAIRGGGLAQTKANRIQQALREIKRKRGKLDLDFLSNMAIPEAREWLMQLPGVGNKTANCVLLFALGKPALPVDTHIFRVAKRLGLIREKTTLREAHTLLEDVVPVEDIYEFHVLMIEHGRRICTARHPRCLQCILNNICPARRNSREQPQDD